MQWLATKALMGLCGLGVMLVAAGIADWPRSSAELVVIGASLLGLWAVLLLRASHPVRRPGRGLVPEWLVDRQLPLALRVVMLVAYLMVIVVLTALAVWWPTVGGTTGVLGLVGMFAVVAVLELIVRPLVLGSTSTEQHS